MNMTFSELRETQMDRFGRHIAARLESAGDEIPHEFSERLKAARVLALSQRKVIKLETAADVVINCHTAALHFGNENLSLWNWVASWLPLLALVAGIMAITVLQDEKHAEEVADVDTELLTSDLPTDAYTDLGFIQYLRVNHPHS